MNLLLLEPGELDTAGLVRLTGPRAAHLMQVLKVTGGQRVRVGIIDGPRGCGLVVSAGAGDVTLRCTLDEPAPPPPPVDLLLALPRPKVMRRLWAQLAALGVRRIILTNAARVERDYFDTHVLTPESYRPLLVEGLQQARDTRLPAVSIHRRFRILVEDDLEALSDAGTRLVADPGDAATISGVLRSRKGNRVLLAVGPEGGWNAFERELLEAHAFIPVSMGRRTLRSDTACIALLTLVHAAIDGRS